MTIPDKMTGRFGWQLLKDVRHLASGHGFSRAVRELSNAFNSFMDGAVSAGLEGLP